MKLTLLLGFSFTSVKSRGSLEARSYLRSMGGSSASSRLALASPPAHSAEDGCSSFVSTSFQGFLSLRALDLDFVRRSCFCPPHFEGSGQEIDVSCPQESTRKWQVVNTCCWMRWMDLESLMIHFPLPAHSFLDSIFIGPKRGRMKWGRCLAWLQRRKNLNRDCAPPLE